MSHRSVAYILHQSKRTNLLPHVEKTLMCFGCRLQTQAHIVKRSCRHHRCCSKEQKQSEKQPQTSLLRRVLPFTTDPSAGIGS